MRGWMRRIGSWIVVVVLPLPSLLATAARIAL